MYVRYILNYSIILRSKRTKSVQKYSFVFSSFAVAHLSSSPDQTTQSNKRRRSRMAASLHHVDIDCALDELAWLARSERMTHHALDSILSAYSALAPLSTLPKRIYDQRVPACVHASEELALNGSNDDSCCVCSNGDARYIYSNTDATTNSAGTTKMRSRWKKPTAGDATPMIGAYRLHIFPQFLSSFSFYPLSSSLCARTTLHLHTHEHTSSVITAMNRLALFCLIHHTLKLFRKNNFTKIEM